MLKETTMLNEILRVLLFVFEAIKHVWLLLLLTLPLSVLIREIGISNKLNTLLRKNIYVSILIATLIGAIAPFCSCSVVPVVASLLIAGVPIAPIMSFWLASPSMDPEIFFLSVASLGWGLAIARITATFVMSLLGGVITHHIFGKDQNFAQKILKQQPKSSCDCEASKDIIQIENIVPINTIVPLKSKKSFNLKKIARESLDSIWMVLKFLTIAYIIEALILFYVPESIILGIFGSNPLVSVIKATLIGVPLYTTNLSALGLVGGLLDKGLSDGAALAFLIGGATTTLPAMAAVYKLVHRKVFALYLSIAIGFSIISGVIMNLIM
jgi:Predicted permeases